MILTDFVDQSGAHAVLRPNECVVSVSSGLLYRDKTATGGRFHLLHDLTLEEEAVADNTTTAVFLLRGAVGLPEMIHLAQV